MKLILTREVNKLGNAGDVVNVKDGYARNFLLPRGVAIVWTQGGEKQIEGIRRARAAREVRDDSGRAMAIRTTEAQWRGNPVPVDREPVVPLYRQAVRVRVWQNGLSGRR